jgi:cytochrome c-type biogenesis protein CcmE
MAMTRKQKRLSLILGLAVVLGIATTLVLTALRDQIVFFYSPTELHTKAVAAGTPVRLGGLVKDGSWKKNGENNNFIITDGGTDTDVTYVGILPDLFREGQGIVAEGSLAADGTFTASNVLAKHDENYIPKEVADELKARGEWRPDDPGAALQAAAGGGAQ